MEQKKERVVVEKTGDEFMQKMIGDILLGLKAKMVQPVMDGNAKIDSRLEELAAGNLAQHAEIIKQLEKLEGDVQKLPLVILTAIRDAINQAGGGNRDGL
ncbi:MAG: hypothetical protein BWY65_01403 [Firmicutes bacterium ADurb.Bin373]|nr:hypothetical protein [Bacillota bacterium]OQA08669.1 MAG: hypothetical protein BWY65_01403 [Firmicutes bacterium ADurb.Bin373]